MLMISNNLFYTETFEEFADYVNGRECMSDERLVTEQIYRHDLSVLKQGWYLYIVFIFLTSYINDEILLILT